MAIDAKLVAELRARTGLPMMKCKKALQEADGDLDKAVENLRKEGSKTIDKLKGREMKEGLVFTHAEGDAAAAVAVLCETDFVARAKDFVAFGEALVKQLFAKPPAPKGAGASLADFAMADGRTVKDVLDELVGSKIRENMKVGDWAVFKPEQGFVATYVHHNRKVAALVELAGAGIADQEPARQLGQDLGMQVVFHSQLEGLTRDDLDPEFVAKEREIFVAQSQNMPEDKREKIAEGKLAKRLSEVVLLDQPFIKNEKETVAKHVQAVAKELGTDIAVARFARIGAGA